MTIYLLDHGRKLMMKLNHLAAENDQVIRILHFAEPESLLESCLKECPDFIFIRLGETPFNGLTTARKVIALYRDLKVVFISRHLEYATLAWEAGGAGFLAEPLQEVLFKELLERLT